jgi:DNA-binding response OmpR family regulator
MVEIAPNFSPSASSGGPLGGDPRTLAGVGPAPVGASLSRVLVVDDEATIRNVVAKILGKSGYATEVFEKGSDLLHSLRRQPADLVITDVFMPDTDGMQLLLELRKQAHRPKVIVMTGGNAYWASSLVAAKQLGAVATLMKPFSAAELLSAVNIALARPGGAAS